MNGAYHYDDGYWAVEYDAADRVFTVRTLDVHTVPLKLPLSEVIRLAGDAVRDPAAPPDREPLVGISRKEKSLYIAVPEGWTGVLKIPRKELYQAGKKMGKRGTAKYRNRP
jgi:hypothetical protein